MHSACPLVVRVRAEGCTDECSPRMLSGPYSSQLPVGNLSCMLYTSTVVQSSYNEIVKNKRLSK